MRTFKIYSPTCFQVCDEVLILVALLCVTAPASGPGATETTREAGRWSASPCPAWMERREDPRSSDCARKGRGALVGRVLTRGAGWWRGGPSGADGKTRGWTGGAEARGAEAEPAEGWAGGGGAERRVWSEGAAQPRAAPWRPLASLGIRECDSGGPAGPRRGDAAQCPAQPGTAVRHYFCRLGPGEGPP